MNAHGAHRGKHPRSSMQRHSLPGRCGKPCKRFHSLSGRVGLGLQHFRYMGASQTAVAGSAPRPAHNIRAGAPILLSRRVLQPCRQPCRVLHGGRSAPRLPAAAGGAAAAGGTWPDDSQNGKQQPSSRPEQSGQGQPGASQQQSQQQPAGSEAEPQSQKSDLGTRLLETPLLIASSLSHINNKYIKMRRRRKW